MKELLEEVWLTLSDVAEFSGDPQYTLDIDKLRALMIRIHEAKQSL